MSFVGWLDYKNPPPPPFASGLIIGLINKLQIGFHNWNRLFKDI